jgi:uncharacterized membrane protein YtjA (UPF0391 family)
LESLDSSILWEFIAGTSFVIAKVLFVVFLSVFVISLIMGSGGAATVA